MSERNDGGPAFPHEVRMFDGARLVDHVSSQGMTLRDYFAAKAMAGLASSMCYSDRDFSAEAVACYRIADAMLAARESS